MKKAIFTFFLLLTLQLSFAQLSFVGNPDYGQLRNFVYDKFTPNKVYATTYIDKHIMVSNDNGVTWNILYTLNYPDNSPAISQMKLINNGTAISFIQTFGGGNPSNKVEVLDLQSLTIIKEFSFPAGESISVLNNYTIFDDGTMTKATLFATGGTKDKVFYTADGGTSWSKIFDSANYTNVLVGDAVMDPVNPQKIFIARKTGGGAIKGGLMISTDAGVTWTEKLSGLILQTAEIDPVNNNNVYVGTGLRSGYPTQRQAVYKSTDGGSTFTEITGIPWATSGSALKNIPKIEINPLDPNHVVVLADERIAVTRDAGTTWTTTPHAGLTNGTSYYYGINASFNPFNSNEVMISNTRFAKFSTDGGITLTTLKNKFFKTMGNLDLIKINGSDHLLYGVQFGYALKNLVNDQETPISVYTLNVKPISGKIKPMFVDKNIPGRAYTFFTKFDGNKINVSDDYGVTEFPLYTTFDNGYTLAETDPTNSNIVWLATFNGDNTTFFKSDFTDKANPVNTPIALPYNGDYLQGIIFNDNNPNDILVTVGNQVLKSVNGGTTWNRITAGLDDLVLPNIAITLAKNPLNANQYTMAASNGIYTSLDAGNTWTKIYDQLVQKVEHSTQQNGQIIATGYSNGPYLPKVVYSDNGGSTWETRTSTANYYSTVVLSSAIRFLSPTTAEVYLATNSLGIIKDVISFGTLAASNENAIKDDISIYPNPVSDVVNIKLKNSGVSFKVALYSSAGQEVMSAENKTSMDISRLPKGVYLLKLDRDNAKTVVKKIIKK